MCDTLGLPSNYRKVGVMLAKWDRELDQYKDRTEKEVADLEAVFKDSFNYDVRVRNIVNHKRRTPEKYFEEQVMWFVKEFNNPNDLLIVYYSGHGSFNHENNCLELHP
jgi:Caspase domain